MNLKVYQIYFEPGQLQNLSPLTIPYYNEKLTPFFENDVILDLYNQGKIHEAEYFGVLSWRIEHKNHLSLNVLNHINPEWNMYSFKNCIIRHGVLYMGSVYHQHFGYLFNKLMLNLGYNFDDYKDLVNLGLYQNAIVAHRDVYLDYVENWLIPSMKYIENNTDPLFLSYLRSDPNYSLYPPGRREKLQQFLGTPWYQYHTFILERLWSLYYVVNCNKIKLYLL